MFSLEAPSDWVMTSNGIYQRSGLNFTQEVVSRSVHSTVQSATLSYKLCKSMKWNNRNETHNIWSKENNFLVDSICRVQNMSMVESTKPFWVHGAMSTQTNYQTYQERYKHRGGNVDAPLICSVSEKWCGYPSLQVGKSLLVDSMFSIIPTVQRTHKARYLIPTQWLNNSTRCSYR